MACNYKRMLQCIYVNKEMFILLTKHQPTSMLRPQSTTKTFYRTHWQMLYMGLETAAIPRRVNSPTYQRNSQCSCWCCIKAKSSRPLSWHWLKFHQQEFSMPFELLPPVEPATHMPLEVNEVFIAPNNKNYLCKLKTHYMTYPLDRLMMMSNYY